jgi:rubrerythrin
MDAENGGRCLQGPVQAGKTMFGQHASEVEGNRMDIFEFALEKEKYSEEYYRDLAGRTHHVGLRNILTMLADEEAKHYRTVEQMKAERPEEVTGTPILEHARDIFQKMRGSARKFSFNINEADLYRKACEFETKSKRFYLEKAEEVEDPAQKDIFRKLAREEEKHLFLMENLRSFVARPETFLENAEIYHFDDYVGGEF